VAITQCPDCGGNVSTEAAACPHCGRPAMVNRSLAADKQPRSPSSRAVFLFLLLGVLGFVTCVVVMGGPQKAAEKSQSSSTSAAVPPHPAVPYRVLKESPIPLGGGFTRVVVVSPSQRTDAGMRALGEQLRADTSRDRNAYIVIYDDERAAGLRDDAAFGDRLSPEDQAFHDAHDIGYYSKGDRQYSLDFFLGGIASEEGDTVVQY